MNGPPAGFTRRPQMSELTRSVGCQSGPCSRITTFLPWPAMTAANTEPDAPAPTMTTSTFSCVAMSPPRLGFDVGHVGNFKPRIAFGRAVDHIDRVAARHEINERSGRSLPAVDLVLAHAVDEVVLARGVELREALAVDRRARALDRSERGAVEIHVGRPHVENARLEQRFLGLNRDLLVDEMHDAGLARAGNERLAQGFERFGFLRTQGA